MADIKLTINGKVCTAPAGSTILQAAERNGIHIPKLCYLEGINQYGACRICVVEQVSPPAKNLQASCMVEAKDGMVIETNNARVQEARKTMYELLLSNHDKKCLTCARNQDCEFQALGRELGVEDSPYEGERDLKPIDVSESITRDPNKCILCGDCVRVCEELQGQGILNYAHRGSELQVMPAFDKKLDQTKCVGCGQCAAVCTTGAITVKNQIGQAWQALHDPKNRVVVQIAPAVRVALGEEFGLPAGANVMDKLVKALKLMGVEEVYDTNFAADMTTISEAQEFLDRLKNGGPFPMFTSCCPAWVDLLEKYHQDMISHFSTCKSPQSMVGALAKTYYADKMGLDPAKIRVISIMPCTAKKWEIVRSEDMSSSGFQDVDVSLTTRELARMIKQAGIDFRSLPDEAADNPLGEYSGAGTIFGATGGVMTAALRTAYFYITGTELGELNFREIEGLDGIKEAEVEIASKTIRIAVAHGTGNVEKVLERIRAAKAAGEEIPYHFVEVMACRGGCIAGNAARTAETARHHRRHPPQTRQRPV